MENFPFFTNDFTWLENRKSGAVNDVAVKDETNGLVIVFENSRVLLA